MNFKMQLKDSLKKELPAEKLDFLPAGYQRVGDIAMLYINKGLEGFEKLIGETVKEQLKVKSVFQRKGISGEFRKPCVKRIAGRRNVTIHKENGCLFKIDVSKVMFAKGNVFERGRLTAGEEDVADFFAGIGYYTISLAKKSNCHVTAIEKNPVAFRLLKENIRLNKLKNVEAVRGDCRDQELKADRIIMGYFPGTEAFLEKAFSSLRREGIIHYHNLHRKGELWRKPLGDLQTKGLEQGYKTEILEKRIVKQYSPCKYHIVVDAKVRK